MPISFDLSMSSPQEESNNDIGSILGEKFTAYEDSISENPNIYFWPKDREPSVKEQEKLKKVADNVTIKKLEDGQLGIEAASPEQSEKLQELLSGKEVTIYDSSGNILKKCTITIILSSEAKQALKAKYDKDKQKSEESTEKSKVLTQKTEERRVLKKTRRRIQRIQTRAQVALRDLDKALRNLPSMSSLISKINR